jgi:excinuclease ABC subunit C
MSLTAKIKKRLLELPDKPGVYLFYNKKNQLIYIGKATSLKNRVRSYFQGQRTPRPIESMIHEVADLRWQTTDSTLEAIILEATNIKNYQPKYNVIGKDDKSWNYLIITREPFPRLLVKRQHELDQQTPALQKKSYTEIFGPYPHLKARETLKILRKLFFYSDCTPNSGRPCFYYQLNQCFGVCLGEISTTDYKNKVIKPLIKFLSGKKTLLLKSLEREMQRASKVEDFEEALRLRNQIRALTHIHDITLIDKNFFQFPEVATAFTLEGYDISNLGTTGKVASLVFFDETGPVKSRYRKFKIKTVTGQSDVDCLKEILERRLQHSDWPLPDYWLVDGGKPQLGAARQVLEKNGTILPIIGIAKGPARRKNEFFFYPKSVALSKFIEQNSKLLIQARDEAHRFAIKYQRQTRKIK